MNEIQNFEAIEKIEWKKMLTEICVLLVASGIWVWQTFQFIQIYIRFEYVCIFWIIGLICGKNDLLDGLRVWGVCSRKLLNMQNGYDGAITSENRVKRKKKWISPGCNNI